jgi:hypothetical protein
LLKRYSIFFRFGIIDFLSLVSLISNFSRFIACKCYSPFTINIQFTLFLLLLLVLGNDVHPNPGPYDYELSIFHLNARSVRNKLSYVEDIASESSIIITSYQIISPEAKFRSYLGFTQISCDVYTRTPPPKQFQSFLNI